MENVKVLIIEDNPVDAFYLKDALEESKTTNFVISHVETLAEGRESLANADFHVVVVDLGLPDSEGLETFSRIQNSAPTTAIVVLSGLDDEILAREAVRKGAQDYLLKGKYDGHLLTRSITYAIERKRAQEEIRRLNEDLEIRIKERTHELTTANEKLLLEITNRKKAEEAALESKAKLEAALASMTDAVFISDVEGNFIDFNEAFATFHKFINKEECAKTLSEYPLLLDVYMDSGELAPLEQWAVPRALRGETVANAEYRLRRKDTGETWVGSYSFAPILDRDSVIVGSVATARDITESKRAQEALCESEQRYRSLFDNMLEGLAHCKMLFQDGKPEDFVYLNVNESFERLTGLKDVVGKKVTEVIPGIRESNPELLEIYGRVALSEEPERFETYVEPLGIWFSISVYSPEREYFVAVFDNITERKQTEEALRQSEELRRLALDAARAGAWEWDLRTNENFWSDELWALYDMEPHSCKPSYEAWRQTIHPDDREQAERAVKEAASNGVELNAEWRTNHGMAERRWLMSRGRPLPDASGRTSRYIGIVVDITDLKRAERLIRESEKNHRLLIENLAAGVLVCAPDTSIQLCNKVAAEIIGLTPEEIVGRKTSDPAWSLISEDGSPMAFDEYPVNRILATGRPIADVVLGFHRPGTDGPIWVLANAYPAFNEKNELEQLVVTFVDITDRKKVEEALRQSEMEKSLILESAAEMFTYYDLDLRVRWANRACADSAGLKPEDLIGRHCYEIWQGQQTPCKDCPVISARDTGLPQQAEQVTPDGRVWSLRGYPVKDVRGEIVGLIEFIQDITERKRAEKALQESEQRYRAIFNIASVGIDLVDDEGRFLEANSALCQILGFTQEELRQLTILDVTHPEDVGKSRDMHEDMVRGEMDDYRLEKRYVRKDGAIVWSDTAASTIRDSGGRYGATVGVIRDITQSKKSEEIRVRLAAAVEQAAETVVVSDSQGTIVYANPAFERTTGYTVGEAEGKNPRILKSGHHGKEFYKRLWDTIRGGKIWTGHFINKKKDGSLYEEDASISPVKAASGEIVNYVAVKRDVTREVSLQKQLLQAQKMEAIGTLAGGVAHDFNNILQVSLGYADLMLNDEEFPRRYRTDLRKIHESAQRGSDLVQRLLTFSRKTEIRLRPLNLNTRITELRKMLERTLPKMIDVQLLLAKDLARISADPTQVDQVLMNLCVNARDAMPEGGKLVIETANVDLDEEYAMSHLDAHPGSYVRLMITDTGSGIDAETREHIFEPFYTTKSVGEGTGLGLAVVHGIVKHHGAHIRCYSEPSEGTSFKIYFPALISEEEEPQIAAKPMPRGGSETILLVDDEDFIRDLGSRILGRAGYKVITASNGKDALGVYQLRRDKIALIVLDLMMPEMSGKQCLEEILKIDPSAKVIIASGFSTNGPVKDALTVGAKGFVNKPYDIRQMMEIVREALDSD